MKYQIEYYDQCFKAVKVNRDELKPTELFRYVSLADTAAVLSGREIDTLVGLCKHGPLAVGCEPSKAGRSDLVEKGLCVAVVVKGDPSNYAATNDGYEVWRMYEASKVEGSVKASVTETSAASWGNASKCGSVFFQVTPCGLAALMDKYPFPISVVRNLEEMKAAKGHCYVALVGSPAKNRPYGWILESGEEIGVFGGDALVDPWGKTLRDKNKPSGEVWDPVEHIFTTIQKLPEPLKLLRWLEKGTVVPTQPNDDLQKLIELGAVEPGIYSTYHISELGVRVKEML